jgi:hypothetical protein
MGVSAESAIIETSLFLPPPWVAVSRIVFRLFCQRASHALLQRTQQG